MESESKREIEDGLKCREVDQDLKPVKTNNELTNVQVLELSDDCFSELDDSELQELMQLPDSILDSDLVDTSDKYLTTPPISALSEQKMESRRKLDLPCIQEGLSQDSRKDTEIDSESSIIEMSEVTNKSSDVYVPLVTEDDREEVEEHCKPKPPGGKQTIDSPPTDNAGVDSKRPKRVRHLDCKHSIEELNTMSLKLPTRKKMKVFMHQTYYKGADPDRLMETLSVKYKAGDELWCIAKDLPNRKLKKCFRDAVKLGQNPDSVMRAYLMRPDVQELILRQKLKLGGNNKLLSKMFQQPDVSPNSKPFLEEKLLTGEQSHQMTARMSVLLRPDGDNGEREQSKYDPSKPIENVYPVKPTENTGTGCEKLEPGALKPDANALPTTLSLKEWFSRFLQDRMSLDEAIRKVRELLLQSGYLTEGNADRAFLNPSNVESASNRPANKASSNVAEFTQEDPSNKDSQIEGKADIKLSYKQKKRRAGRFQKLNEEQLKVCDSWREKGLVHQDALTKVLDRFYPTREPGSGLKTSGAESVCSEPNADEPCSMNACAPGESYSRHRTRFMPTSVRNASAWEGHRGASMPWKVWEDEPQPSFVPGPKPNPINQPLLDGIVQLLYMQIVRNAEHGGAAAAVGSSLEQLSEVRFGGIGSGGNLNTVLTPYSTVPEHSCVMPPTTLPGPSSHLKRESAFEEHGVHTSSRFVGEPSTDPLWDLSSDGGTRHLFSVGLGYPIERSWTSLKRENVNEPAEVHKRSRFGELRTDSRDAGTQWHPDREPASFGDTLHLCVVPSGYPSEYLSDEQMDAIENSILEAVLEIDDETVEPTFKEASRNNGRYEVICENERSKKWLYKYASRIQPWPNGSLKIIPAGWVISPSEEETKTRASALPPLRGNEAWHLRQGHSQQTVRSPTFEQKPDRSFSRIEPPPWKPTYSSDNIERGRSSLALSQSSEPRHKKHFHKYPSRSTIAKYFPALF